MKIVKRFFWAICFVLVSAVISYVFEPSTRDNIINDAIPEIAHSTCLTADKVNQSCHGLQHHQCEEQLKQTGMKCINNAQFRDLNDEIATDDKIKTAFVECMLEPLDNFEFKTPVSATCVREIAKYTKTELNEMVARFRKHNVEMSPEAANLGGRLPASK